MPQWVIHTEICHMNMLKFRARKLDGHRQLTKWQLSYGKGWRANEFPKLRVYYDTDVKSNNTKSLTWKSTETVHEICVISDIINAHIIGASQNIPWRCITNILIVLLLRPTCCKVARGLSKVICQVSGQLLKSQFECTCSLAITQVWVILQKPQF